MTTAPTVTPTRNSLPYRLGVVAGLAGLAALVAVTLLALNGSLATPTAALLDPGPAVRWSIPALRSVYDLCASLTIGLLVLATFVLPPERDTDEAELHGRRLAAVRIAAGAATGWLASGVALLVLTYADVAGTRPGSPNFTSQLKFYIREIDLGRSAFISLVIVLLVATCAGGVMRINPTGWLAFLSLVALFPVALAGHAAGSDDHQNAVDSLLIHLVGVTVWVGGLLGLVLLFARHDKRDGGLATAARRYSTLALWCFVAVALSGVASAWIRVGSLDRLASAYGALLAVKVVLLVVLGIFGWRQRARQLDRLDDAKDDAEARSAFLRFSLVDLAVMAGTIGVAVALARTRTPAPEDLVPDRIAGLLGHPFPGEQTAVGLLTKWYPNLLFLTGALLLAGLYAAGVWRLHRRGDRWAPGRTVAWMFACAVFVYATSGGPAVYARSYFSGHMLQHMTLMMLVPIFLVLGAPVTLALRALTRRDDESRGPREWLLAALHSRYARIVSNPIVAAVLFIGSLVAFYYTGLFQLSLATHTGHILMTVHFVLVGYLFVWVLIGVDPGPPHPPYPLRLLLLLATISFHAFFGLALMSGDAVLAPDWWASVLRTDQAELIADQRLGGGIAWGVGELPTAILIVILGIMWARDDDREARRLDRKADRDGDVELTAWNDQFTRLADRDDRAER